MEVRVIKGFQRLGQMKTKIHQNQILHQTKEIMKIWALSMVRKYSIKRFLNIIRILSGILRQQAYSKVQKKEEVLWVNRWRKSFMWELVLIYNSLGWKVKKYFNCLTDPKLLQKLSVLITKKKCQEEKVIQSFPISSTILKETLWMILSWKKNEVYLEISLIRHLFILRVHVQTIQSNSLTKCKLLIQLEWLLILETKENKPT